jgi:hypothetical protein
VGNQFVNLRQEFLGEPYSNLFCRHRTGVYRSGMPIGMLQPSDARRSRPCAPSPRWSSCVSGICVSTATRQGRQMVCEEIALGGARWGTLSADLLKGAGRS